MTTRYSVATKVAASKANHPEFYCPHHKCLWRTGDGSLCPRHGQRMWRLLTVEGVDLGLYPTETAAYDAADKHIAMGSRYRVQMEVR